MAAVLNAGKGYMECSMISKLRTLVNIYDIFLIGSIVVICIMLFIGHHSKHTTLHANIYLYDSLLGSYDLSGSKVIKINVHASAEIKNGKIRMFQSDCPDQRCVRQGWTDKVPIICLPNHIEIEVIQSDKLRLHLLY